ncbi:MAG: MCE family protein [Candidatus Melainabacteria bacterium]|nr:MCE family protein [Candidatus Melainabacteria bacterium]
MKHFNEMKIGAFVISGLVLLVFGWAYLREFSIQVQQSFSVVFNDVAGLTKGSFVRINGLRVGRVDKLILDTKENKVIVDARIQLPDINIPNDSKIIIRTSGYVGDKYLDIILGMSQTHIMSGDVIIGEPTLDPFQSLEKISQILNQIDPKIVGANIQDVTVNAATLIKKADSVIESTDRVVMSLPQGEDLKLLVEKAHDTVEQLNTAIEKAQNLATDQSAQNNLNKILKQASVVSSDLNQTLKNANKLANNKAAFENVNSLLLRATKIIEELDEIRADPLIQNELRQTLNNANEAAKKFAFTSEEVSMALNQRFILPRLLFGKLVPNKKKADKIKD